MSGIRLCEHCCMCKVLWCVNDGDDRSVMCVMCMVCDVCD